MISILWNVFTEILSNWYVYTCAVTCIVHTYKNWCILDLKHFSFLLKCKQVQDCISSTDSQIMLYFMEKVKHYSSHVDLFSVEKYYDY